MSPLVFPKFAILDPQVTYSLPERQVANGVVDSFIHVVEQYLTYPVNAKFKIILPKVDEDNRGRRPQGLAKPE